MKVVAAVFAALAVAASSSAATVTLKPTCVQRVSVTMRKSQTLSIAPGPITGRGFWWQWNSITGLAGTLSSNAPGQPYPLAVGSPWIAKQVKVGQDWLFRFPTVAHYTMRFAFAQCADAKAVTYLHGANDTVVSVTVTSG